MFTISTFSLSKLNSAEFVGLTINLANLIERCEAAKLGLDSEVMSSFVEVKQKLSDQVRASNASLLTVELDKANKKRSSIFKRIIYRLKGVELMEGNSSLDSLIPAVQVHLLRPYGLSITRMPMQELTTLIAGFVFDAHDKFTEDDLEDLDIANDVSNLESANQEFIAAYTKRSEEKATSSGLTAMLRQQMNDIYLSICYQVQYIANSTLEANASKAVVCQSFIGTLNAMLADAKKRYNQRMNALHGVTDDPSDEGDDENEGDGGNAGGNSNTNGTGGTNTNTGGNTNGTGGNQGGTSGNNQGTGNNTGTGGSGDNDLVIDHENGTTHDGTVEF